MPIKPKLLLLFLLLLFCSLPAVAQDVLVSKGEFWKFLDNGIFPGDDWKSAAFNDSGWASAQAPLGYGRLDVNSVISYGVDPLNKHITTWFRKEFVVQQANQYEKIKLKVRRDDGIVLFLNGVEIGRNNMPEGVISSQTLAASAILGQGQFDYFELELPSNMLSNGKNILAIELHQANASSSDLIFDLDMSAQIFQQLIIQKKSQWRYLATSNSPDPSWKSPWFSDLNWPFGNGILGYGNLNQATVVDYGPDENNKYITTYFRHSFLVIPGQKFPIYSGKILFDDGCVVYVNGIEVFRRNMPPGPIGYQTLAQSSVAGPDESFYSAFAFDSSLIVSGFNVVSVEIHQSQPSSSDMAFDLELMGQRVFGGRLSRGPYLQSVGKNQAIIRWRTTNASPTKIRWWRQSGQNSDSLFDPIPAMDHEVKLVNLVAGETIFYQISDGKVLLNPPFETYTFRTNPPSNSKAPFRVWVLGDQGSIDSGQTKVRDAFYKLNKSTKTDLLLTLGDNAYDGFDQMFQKALFEIYPKTLNSTPFWPCFGNHEAYAGANSVLQVGPYYDMFSLPKNGECGGIPSGTKAYYSFDYGNAHFIQLNSHDIPADSNEMMAQWLKADLQANQKEWVLVYWHHPPYSFGNHNSDSDPNMTRMRTQINPILERFQVDMVITGHSHVYERSFPLKGHFGKSTTFQPSMIVENHSGNYPQHCGYRKKRRGNGLVYVVAGCSGQLAGGPLGYPSSAIDFMKRGSLVLDFNDNQLFVRFVGEKGVILDSFSIGKDIGGKQSISTCKNQPITLTSTWTGNHTWTSGQTDKEIQLTPQQSGSFTYLVQDGFGCFADTFLVNVQDVPDLNLGSDTILLSIQTILLSSQIVGQYLWSTGETSQQIVAQGANIYWLTITLPNGCQISDTIRTGTTVNQVKNRKMEQALLSVFPNPGSGWLTIKTSGPNGDDLLKIFDSKGQQILDCPKQIISPNECRIFPKESGMYLLMSILANGQYQSEKLIIE